MSEVGLVKNLISLSLARLCLIGLGLILAAALYMLILFNTTSSDRGCTIASMEQDS